jgi:formamidase
MSGINAKGLVVSIPDAYELATSTPTTAHMGQMGEAIKAAAAEDCEPFHRASMGRQLRYQGSFCVDRRSIFRSYIDGAGLSVGDLHFSQGDGEITFCGAIEEWPAGFAWSN